MVDRSPRRWPRLSYADWSEAALTLHLWTQIVGKIRLAATPWLNHSWHVPFYVTARGLGTTPIPAGDEILEFEFDFLRHRLVARTSSGEDRSLALEPRSVADFYADVLRLLSSLHVDLAFTDRPSELPDALPFSADRVHSAYDPGKLAHRASSPKGRRRRFRIVRHRATPAKNSTRGFAPGTPRGKEVKI